jgi:hypothetical protein
MDRCLPHVVRSALSANIYPIVAEFEKGVGHVAGAACTRCLWITYGDLKMAAMRTLAASSPAVSQAHCRLSGAVETESGPAPSATVMVASPGWAATTITDAHGRYRFSKLVPGRYSVYASKSGYQLTCVDDVGIAEAAGILDLRLTKT